MKNVIDELAEQCYVFTGSPHTDHFAYWKFAELLKQAIYDKVKTELESEYEVERLIDPSQRYYMRGSNDGTIQALTHIKNFGVEE